MQDGTLLAAIDLGSNSFRLEIARLAHGQVERIEYLKETVRQGGGLDTAGHLSVEAMERGWACLERFAARIAGLPRQQVRAVATQTLREARNREAFLAHAQALLGVPIEVISGREEARLIYRGVAHHLPASDERRLVVDIGGRSTELIRGTGFEVGALESCQVGSVSWSMKYFADGQFSAGAFERAEAAAQAALAEALATCPPGSWDVAYGASGTVQAVGEVLAAAGMPAGVVRQDSLDWLRAELLRVRSADRVRLAGLKEDRRAVIGGGLSVLRAVFRLFGIPSMQVAAGALRHGVLHDLLDRQPASTDLPAATGTGRRG